jgi:hypothetical protein
MRPPSDDALLVEAESRIHSELQAAGLEARTADCRADAATNPDACPDLDAPATISLHREDGVVEINVRAVSPDGLELRRHVRVIDRAGGKDPSVLAVRAVEILRDLQLAARRPAPTGPPRPARDDEVPTPLTPLPPLQPERPREPAPRWHLSLGLAMLASLPSAKPGVGPTLGGVAGLGRVIAPHLIVQVTVAGPFLNGLGTVGYKSASLSQGLGVLELRHQFASVPLQPFAGLIAGVNYLQATIDSNYGSTQTSWSFVPLFGGSIGLWHDASRLLTSSIEAQIFLTAPPKIVNLEGKALGQTGAPSILIVARSALRL